MAKQADCDQCVRAFDPMNGRRRNYTRADAEFLASRKMVVAQRTRQGLIHTIHFYFDSPMPLQNRLRAGTRYSFEHRHGCGKVWELQPLPYRAADAAGGYTEPPEMVDARIRAIFQATALSVQTGVPLLIVPKKSGVVVMPIRSASGSPGEPAKVVSIDAFRGNRKQRRFAAQSDRKAA